MSNKNNLESLDLPITIIQKLNSINIDTVDKLWKTSKVCLKNNNFTTGEIKQIAIKLQLRGLDFNKRVY